MAQLTQIQSETVNSLGAISSDTLAVPAPGSEESGLNIDAEESQANIDQIGSYPGLDLNQDQSGSVQPNTGGISLTDGLENNDTSGTAVVHQNVEHLTSDLPIALRKPKRNTRVSVRLKDMLPCSAAILIAEENIRQKELNRQIMSEEQCPSPGPSQDDLAQELPDTNIASIQTPREYIRSIKNVFHLYRQYDGSEFPAHDPEEEVTLQDLSDIRSQDSATIAGNSDEDIKIDFSPYPNESSFLLGEWYWRAGHQKSKQDFRRLLNIITSMDFSIDDVRRTPWTKIDHSLGESSADAGDDLSKALENAGWILEEVTIRVPFPSRSTISQSKLYSVGHFYRRSIISIIRDRVTSTESRHMHLEPHEVYWEPDDGPAMRVYGELYNSRAFLDAHREVQGLPHASGCSLPRAVIALMFASDETHLTQFGETKLWPLYMFLGNDSKYRRVKPSLHLCNHLAYFIKLPDNFKEFVQAETGAKGPSSALLSHCLRETLHAQWEILLDAEFMEAYEHGIVEKCGFNGKEYRFYPRAFTYGADYKEKVTIISIRNLGNQPCPRCLIPKIEISNLGLETDREWRTEHKRVDDASYRQKIKEARDAIYEHNYVVDSKVAVDSLLKDQSLVPVSTAFSSKLSPFGFDFFQMSVVDLMHEMESGNWRSLFIHILRILDTIGDELTIQVDSRYRQVPTFGQASIRKFRKNVSEMKNLAARDWEDMLQCAIPVFEGLLPEPHNTLLLNLLYCLARWHGLAKLRLHSDATLELMDNLTNELGQHYRAFFDLTCSSFRTRELAKEAAARYRRNQSSNTKTPATGTRDSPLAGVSPNEAEPNEAVQSQNLPSSSPNSGLEIRPDENLPSSLPTNGGLESRPDNILTGGPPQHAKQASGVQGGGRRPKTLNMNTYKFHAMGDYTDTIRRFGTTDSYSTESSELEHRTPKDRYARTNKKDFMKQLVQIERRQARIQTIRNQIDENTLQKKLPLSRPVTSPAPTERFYIGKSQNDTVFIPQFLQENASDLAVKGFFNNLKAHLASRITHSERQEPEETLASHLAAFPSSTLFLHRDTMYRHKTIHFNYTTYDVRRAQDTVNPTRASHNIMVLSKSILDEQAAHVVHPFLYGRVLGVFHVNVVSSKSHGKPQRMDFLWVRWYTHHPPDSPMRLDKLTFPPLGGEDAFGFVDPNDVLRACHVIPCYHQGRRSPDGKSVSKLANDGDDWKSYYVARFADRDLLMRFEWGLGIGHTYWYSSFPKEDRAAFRSALATCKTTAPSTDLHTHPALPFATDNTDAEADESAEECDKYGNLKELENEDTGSGTDRDTGSEKEQDSGDEDI